MSLAKRIKTKIGNLKPVKFISNKIKPFLIVTSRYKNALKVAYSKHTESIIHQSLGPTNKAENIKAYTDTLDKILKNDSIKNIAIIGKYGSGKSSVLRTFF